jgi:peroxiredoxin
VDVPHRARRGRRHHPLRRAAAGSTQRPDQLRAFAEHARLPFPLLSDQDARLAAALRLPTFRVAGTDRLKRLTLLLDPSAVVRAVQFPITDPAGSVDAMLTRLEEIALRSGPPAGMKVGGDE